MLNQGTHLRIPAAADDAISRMAACLQAGGLVVFPTETVYCLGTRAELSHGLERLRAIRSAGALVPHLASPQQASQWTDPLTPYQNRVLSRLWPGPVSITLAVSDARRADLCRTMRLEPDLLYHGDRITLRCPDHPAVRQALMQAGGPILGATAADPAGTPAARCDDLAPELVEQVDLVLDGGSTKYGRPSTLVELGKGDYKVIRPGALEPRLIGRLLRTTILFICSGNTCRSPMAQAIAKSIIASRLATTVADLPKRGIEVLSAGTGAIHGLPASQHALTAVRALGGDLSEHRSQPLTETLIEQADLILAMGRNHAAMVLAMDPAARMKTLTLDPAGDIVDPIGSDLQTYRELAAQMKTLIERRLAEKKLI